MKGFAQMDVSTSIHADPKFRLLSRRYPEQTAGAFTAYVVLMAESWREGERLTLEEAWTLLPYDEHVAAAMADVGLVDPDGRIPEHVWDRWYGAAEHRRELGREKQHRADVKRGRVRPDPSRPAPSRPDLPCPVRTSEGPTDRPTVEEADDEPWNPKWDAFLEEWEKRYHLPPTPKQRRVLWKVVDARPNDVATWLGEARAGCSSFEAMAFIFKRWADLGEEVASNEHRTAPVRPADASRARESGVEAA